MGAQQQVSDPNQELRAADFQDVLFTVSDKVVNVLSRESRSEMDEEDKAFIARRVRKMTREFFDQYMAERAKPTRFRRAERVVCNVGGQRKWASGIIAAVNQDDPEGPTGPKLPYVVKVDPPGARLISVPKDDHDICRAEVCFGQRAGALWFTLFCLPPKQDLRARRFAMGERVACAVEDESNDYSIWAAGTVLAVNHNVEQWAGQRAHHLPYQVQLETWRSKRPDRARPSRALAAFLAWRGGIRAIIPLRRLIT